MPAKTETVSFRKAFGRVVLHRTGLAVSDRIELHQDLLDNELELALRLNGFADDGDAVDIFPSEDSKEGKEGKGGKENKESASKEASSKGAPGKGKGEGKGGASTSKGAVSSWSEDAAELLAMVRRLGPRNANLCSEAFLTHFFRHLRLPELAIASPLTEEVCKFSRLTSLDLSRNALTDIDQLPPNIRFLKAYNNRISRISCKSTPSLSFLGLGYNPICDVTQITKRFPQLLSLDLTFTEVASFDEQALKLQALSKLRQLCFLGSPVCLFPFYRLGLLRKLPLLQVLDGVLLSEEELADAQLQPKPSTPPAPAGDSAEEQGEEVAPDPRASVGGGDTWLRLRLELGKLTQHTALLREALMKPGEEEAFLAEQEAKAAEAEEAGEDEPLKRDALSEKVGQQGEVRLSFQLPDGTWIDSNKVKLAKKTYEVEEDEPKPPVELKSGVSMRRLRQASDGGHLCFELDLVPAGKGKASVSELCHWLRQGLPLKLFFCPEVLPPPAAEGEAETAEASGSRPETAEAVEGADAEAAEALAAEAAAKAAEAAAKAAAEAEIPLGGCLVPLEHAFLRRTTREVLPDFLPVCPEPWTHSSPVQIVPMKEWLHPETQVPASKAPKEPSSRTELAANLDLTVTLYAMPPPTEEEAESEEEAVEPPVAAKGKAKAKAKGKK